MGGLFIEPAPTLITFVETPEGWPVYSRPRPKDYFLFFGHPLRGLTTNPPRRSVQPRIQTTRAGPLVLPAAAGVCRLWRDPLKRDTCELAHQGVRVAEGVAERRSGRGSISSETGQAKGRRLPTVGVCADQSSKQHGNGARPFNLSIELHRTTCSVGLSPVSHASLRFG